MKKFILSVLCFTFLFSAAFFVNGCQKKHEHSDVGNKPENNISFRTLSVGEKNIDGNIPVYGKVPNVQTKFSFIDEVTTTGNIQYIVSLDIYGIQQVATKTIPLTEGDNVVYITEQLNGNPKAVYEVTIRRREIYTATFNPQGGSAVESQQIEEDSLIIEPTTIKTGYSFTGWNYDFTQPITEDTTITAAWTANTNTAYKVEYYLENLEDNNYTLLETENLQGTTDTTATAEIKTHNHFTFNKYKSMLSGNVSGDGSLVLKVYYTRNTYTLSNANTSYGEITNATTKKYGNDKIVSVATEYLGCEFLGWYNGEELLSIAKEFTFTVENNVTAKFKVKDEMSNFNFFSSVGICNITGLKDKTISKITIPDYVTSIGDYAFSGCSRLTSVIWNAENCISAGSYDYSIFSGCSKLSNITIGKSVKTIPSYAFKNCSGLTSVTIPNSVTSIGNWAFGGCDNLKYNEYDNGYYLGNSNNPYVVLMSAKNTSISSCIINKSTKIIYESAFVNCSSITSITIPDGVTSICSWTFNGCSSLVSITIPDGVTSIGSWAFSYCSSLASITIPDGVTSIGSWAFSYCSSLASITIPDGVASIGDGAFDGCSSLTSVTIGNGVTSIGLVAFRGCNGIESLVVTTGNKKYHSTNNCIIETETKTLVAGCKTSVIPSDGSVTSIGDGAFNGCSSLTSVTIGNGVTSIGNSAFIGCSSLTSVTLHDGVTSIGYSAFRDCSRLTSITIHIGVTSIGYWAFENCSGLKTVFYKGTAEQWDKISIDSYNTNLTNASRYYYNENEPALNSDGSDYDGNYWHYDTDGITPVIWKKEN